MIHFVQGKPGGGKTLFAVKKIVDELVTSNRQIVTNVPLKLDRLNEFLQERYPDENIPVVGLDSRVRLLDESDEARKLLRQYRDAWQKAKRSRNVEQQEAVYQEYEKKIEALGVPQETRKFWEFRNPRKLRFDDAVGTLFVLDEVHLHFNARKWAETADECLHYLSQHRKFGDDVICVTQHPDNVDKQFRSVAQDFSVIKNGYTAKIGYFRGLPAFTRKTYATQPNGQKMEPMETAHFRLDAQGYASCYDTAAGVGILGTSADKEKPKRGLHPAWFVVGLFSFAALVFFGLKAVVGAQVKRLSVLSSVKAPAQNAPLVETSKAVDVPARTVPLEQTLPLKSSSTAAPVVTSQTQDLWVRGYVVSGRKVNVHLSDGRILTEDDPELERVRRNGVVVSGQKLFMRPLADPAKPLESSGSSPSRRSEGVLSDSEARSREAKASSGEVPSSMVSSSSVPATNKPLATAADQYLMEKPVVAKSSMADFDSVRRGSIVRTPRRQQ